MYVMTSMNQRRRFHEVSRVQGALVPRSTLNSSPTMLPTRWNPELDSVSGVAPSAPHPFHTGQRQKHFPKEGFIFSLKHIGKIACSSVVFCYCCVQMCPLSTLT